MITRRPHRLHDQRSRSKGKEIADQFGGGSYPDRPHMFDGRTARLKHGACFFRDFLRRAQNSAQHSGLRLRNTPGQRCLGVENISGCRGFF